MPTAARRQRDALRESRQIQRLIDVLNGDEEPPVPGWPRIAAELREDVERAKRGDRPAAAEGVTNSALDVRQRRVSLPHPRVAPPFVFDSAQLGSSRHALRIAEDCREALWLLVRTESIAGLRQCSTCEKFLPFGSKATYCSAACRVARYRADAAARSRDPRNG